MSRVVLILVLFLPSILCTPSVCLYNDVSYPLNSQVKLSCYETLVCGPNGQWATMAVDWGCEWMNPCGANAPCYNNMTTCSIQCLSNTPAPTPTPTPTPQPDTCPPCTYMCRMGTTCQVNQTTCEATCVPTPPTPGTCAYDGHVYPLGTHMNQSCTPCTCQVTGWECDHPCAAMTCLANSTCQNNVKTCEPTCVPALPHSTCSYLNQSYNVGDTSIQSCAPCTCSVTGWQCAVLDDPCAATTCAVSQYCRFNTATCEPQCVEPTCSYMGVSYNVSQTITQSCRPCTCRLDGTWLCGEMEDECVFGRYQLQCNDPTPICRINATTCRAQCYASVPINTTCTPNGSCIRNSAPEQAAFPTLIIMLLMVWISGITY